VFVIASRQTKASRGPSQRRPRSRDVRWGLRPQPPAAAHSEAHERKVSRDTTKSAPSQACICQTTRSVLYEQVNQVGTTNGGRLSRTVFGDSTVRSRKYFLEAPQNALSRSRSRGRRQKTPRNGPLAPAPQAPHHARAPAEDDPPRSRPSTGAHAPAASSPRARSAGQPIIASCNMALSGRVTAPL
jgi:hypothetical protein